jgi:hypothetical protein
MTYGISMNTFPLTDEGELPLDNHNNWMVKQHILESITSCKNDDEREVISGSSDIPVPRGRNRDADELSTDRKFELSPVSRAEREQLHFSDIDAVSDAIDETPEFLEANLAKLENELANMTKNKEVYLQAEAEDNGYTRCRQLRLKFLRAESFDAKKAAERMAMFFEEKLMLFGPKLLAKDVKLRDLDENDIKCLESGIGQLLPQRDRAGRCVFAWIMANGTIDNASDQQIAKNKVGGSRNVFFCLRTALSLRIIGGVHDTPSHV